MIAITYNERPLLRILKATDLKPLAIPNTSGLGGGDLGGSVAWSADGRTLYAGGSYDEGGRFPVFAWAQAGRGTRQAVMSFPQTVSGLVTLPDGTLVGVAFDATQQAAGRLGERLRWGVDAEVQRTAEVERRLGCAGRPGPGRPAPS